MTEQKLSAAKEATVWDHPNVIFSQKQKTILELLSRQVQNINSGTDNQPHMTIIQGKAGSGKSTVIKAICAQLHDVLGPESFRLLAPTGAAAVNILVALQSIQVGQ